MLGTFTDFCFIYMDDVLAHDLNEQDHVNYLKMTFRKIREEGLQLKLLKCGFFKCYLQHLGHFIPGEGIYSQKEKVASLINLALSTNVTETRHIKNLASYYRKFIANFSNVVRPLTELTKKSTLFVWSALCKVSFDTIKIVLT